jgi:hypothetical protein
MQHEKDFITLSSKECLVVYKQVLEKSKKKFDSAEALAKIEDYDSATALFGLDCHSGYMLNLSSFSKSCNKSYSCFQRCFYYLIQKLY